MKLSMFANIKMKRSIAAIIFTRSIASMGFVFCLIPDTLTMLTPSKCNIITIQCAHFSETTNKRNFQEYQRRIPQTFGNR